WNGATWANVCALDTGWLAAVAGLNWTKGAPMPPMLNASGFEDGKDYTIKTRAFDVAANTQTAISGKTFRLDASSPTAAIQLPANGSYYNSLTQISGTAQDNGPYPGPVTFPQVRIYDIQLNSYWNGAAWVASANNWLNSIDSTSVSGVANAFTWR